MSPSSTSSRWCPTPEQLMILEELYRGGIRTPNAPQIQRITAHLSLYGRIEGKNVFYWFQNHKARDRQKLRRKLIKQLQQQQMYHYDHLDQLQQNQSNYHLLNYFDPPAGSDFIQLPYHCSASFLPQVGGLDQGATPEMINYTWKLEIPQMFQTENPMMRMCGHDWMTMVDVGSSSPCCTTRPLKTLELFPITTTNVKEEYCSSTSSKHLPYDASATLTN